MEEREFTVEAAPPGSKILLVTIPERCSPDRAREVADALHSFRDRLKQAMVNDDWPLIIVTSADLEVRWLEAEECSPT